MLFPEDDAPLLKAWIVKRIEDTSDADSDVLADYVIALLKHDGDRESVRRLCEQEIPDFLTEEYDPAKAMMNVLQTPDAAAPGWPARGKQRGGRKGGARAPFSAEGPVTDHSKTTIVVENIPEEHFSEDQVRGFFSQFGNICQVSMQPYKHLAIVKFETWASANNAYRSPSVIFDNRFVKVFWYKDDKEKLPPSGPVPVTPANGTKLAPGSGNEAADAEPGIDMEEFQRRQEEAQKAYKEREDKRSALEKQRQELERKQQELLSKHQAEAERLQAKLAGKLGGGKEASPSASGADMLRAKLAALEQEAKMLGLDPNAAADDSSRHAGQAAAYHRGRGGHRGRASAYRGRGSFSAQAGRHAAYSQFSLDNRPKKLAVTGVDFTASDKDERLRHFLLNLGEFESVHTTPTVTHVSFRDRKTAEKFYSSLHGNELPGVEGRLELSWLSGVGAGASASVSVSVSGTGDATAGIDDDGPEEPREEQVREEERPVNMDYEVGDDYGWEG
ncbi:hypothetical protein UVI_02040670 [Ustilaginoidea virens]|uniref:RRM domain-containing protein n=1 Tax=Ustilaginoidea virens TaxID=1159556 RepID=A0A1B5L5C1_USTVR|nr:hypothetical protein UVI_02040670 [Ustilaginoidea virens]